MGDALFDLSGKVALITGGSRGIGRAIALRMAEHGAKLVVTSRKLDACETVAETIRAAGGEALALACDITDDAALKRLPLETMQAFGRIDILVCNAAINPHFGPSAEVTQAAFERTLSVNLGGTFRLCNDVLPLMAAQGGGAIILMSSIAGSHGADRLGIYALAKAAEQQLARNIAVEWGGRNIRANAIAPGLIRTDFAKALWSDPEIYRQTVEGTPLRRIGEPDDIAGAAVFLASEAGRFITGQTLVIDGGITIAGH